MNKAEKEEVWKSFWQRERSASTPAIVSTEWNEISKAQFEAWADFAENIGPDARVIDFATGAGKLPKLLHAARPDLRITGIDIANPLPDASEGIELIGGVTMEDVPFPADSFDVAVSQFGFEYGDSLTVSAEMLRVLRSAGKIGLMVHRGDGPILAHNRKREAQIRWVKEENALFSRLRAMLPEDNGLARDARNLAQDLAARGLDQFGHGSVAWELPEAVRRALDLGARDSRQKLLETLRLIDGQSDHELGRIQSLAEACATADDRDSLLAGFLEHGRAVVSTIPVGLPGAEPFADLITL